MLDPAKLRAMRERDLRQLAARTAGAHALLLEVREDSALEDVVPLLRFLGGAALVMQRELRRREEETQLRAAFLDELDPAQVDDAP